LGAKERKPSTAIPEKSIHAQPGCGAAGVLFGVLASYLVGQTLEMAHPESLESVVIAAFLRGRWSIF